MTTIISMTIKDNTSVYVYNVCHDPNVPIIITLSHLATLISKLKSRQTMILCKKLKSINDDGYTKLQKLNH